MLLLDPSFLDITISSWPSSQRFRALVKKVRIHVSSCSLSVRDYNLDMTLKSAGQGIALLVKR
jgi:hypothetical protein